MFSNSELDPHQTDPKLIIHLILQSLPTYPHLSPSTQVLPTSDCMSVFDLVPRTLPVSPTGPLLTPPHKLPLPLTPLLPTRLPISSKFPSPHPPSLPILFQSPHISAVLSRRHIVPPLTLPFPRSPHL